MGLQASLKHACHCVPESARSSFHTCLSEGQNIRALPCRERLREEHTIELLSFLIFSMAKAYAATTAGGPLAKRGLKLHSQITAYEAV